MDVYTKFVNWKTSYTISLPELTRQIKIPKNLKPKIKGGLTWEEIQFIKEKIEKSLSEITNKKQNPTKSPITKLSLAFEDISKYNKVMDILVEKGYCQPNTYNWIDLKGGNKSTIVFLLKNHLHAQRYFKENRRLANNEVRIIAKNTFGVDISESLIKQNKNEDKSIQKIIPPASSL